MIRYYDRDGNEIGIGEWAELFADMDYRRIAYKAMGEDESDVEVSTVWTGISVKGDGSDIFEIMLTAEIDPDDDLNTFIMRAGSIEQAVKIHNKLVMRNV